MTWISNFTSVWKFNFEKVGFEQEFKICIENWVLKIKCWLILEIEWVIDDWVIEWVELTQVIESVLIGWVVDWRLN